MPDGYGSPWGNLQRPNTQMVQYGMQMMQPRAPGQAWLQPPPFSGGGSQPQAQTLLNVSQDDSSPRDEAPSPQGKRRIRIGNKVYIEE